MHSLLSFENSSTLNEIVVSKIIEIALRLMIPKNGNHDIELRWIHSLALYHDLSRSAYSSIVV